MTNTDIITSRLINQQIAATTFTKPEEIVSWLVAMQAQEYAMSKWSIGLRLPGINDATVEKAFNDGAILRTHLMRPTWHFVTPADIRWLLVLTAPRVHAVNAYWYKKFELDITVFKRCNDMLVTLLAGGKQITRAAIKSALERISIFADGLRFGYLLMQAELDGIICSGPRQGKQFTYALLDERVPCFPVLSYEQALSSLTARYFASRGPATVQDFAWWSGLSTKDATAGVAMLTTDFMHEKVNGHEYFFLPTDLKRTNKMLMTFLMPDYDEYGISYKDRNVILHLPTGQAGVAHTAYNRMIVIDGRIAGAWERVIESKRIVVKTTFFRSLNKREQEAVSKAAARYGVFADILGE